MMPRKQKKTLSIQYGYGKCGTHARVLSQTLAHDNSMNEIRESHKKRREARRDEKRGECNGKKIKNALNSTDSLINYS